MDRFIDGFASSCMSEVIAPLMSTSELIPPTLQQVLQAAEQLKALAEADLSSLPEWWQQNAAQPTANDR